MNAPHTYAEWVVILERFGSGDDTVIELMAGGSVQWTNVVAERWTRQVSGVMETRLRALSQQLQTALDRSRGEFHAVAGALVGARRGLAPLRDFVVVPCIPQQVREHLSAELDRWVSETQASLERSAAEVWRDQGWLLKTIRDNPFNSRPAKSPPEDDEPAPPGGAGPATRGRRIIL